MGYMGLDNQKNERDLKSTSRRAAANPPRKEQKKMIKKGTIQVNGSKLNYTIKYFDEPSEFGIGEGRISKLEIRNDGHVVCGYDRGWYDVPASPTAKAALQMLIAKFN